MPSPCPSAPRGLSTCSWCVVLGLSGSRGSSVQRRWPRCPPCLPPPAACIASEKTKLLHRVGSQCGWQTGHCASSVPISVQPSSRDGSLILKLGRKKNLRTKPGVEWGSPGAWRETFSAGSSPQVSCPQRHYPEPSQPRRVSFHFIPSHPAKRPLSATPEPHPTLKELLGQKCKSDQSPGSFRWSPGSNAQSTAWAHQTLQVGRVEAGELPGAGGRVSRAPEQTQEEQQHQAAYQGEQRAPRSHPEPRAPSPPKLPRRSAARAAPTRRSGHRRRRCRHRGRCHAHPQRSKAVARARTLGVAGSPACNSVAGHQAEEAASRLAGFFQASPQPPKLTDG